MFGIGYLLCIFEFVKFGICVLRWYLMFVNNFIDYFGLVWGVFIVIEWYWVNFFSVMIFDVVLFKNWSDVCVVVDGWVIDYFFDMIN